MVLGMVCMALAGAVIPLWAVVDYELRRRDREAARLPDWQPTSATCGPNCSCGSSAWS